MNLSTRLNHAYKYNSRESKIAKSHSKRFVDTMQGSLLCSLVERTGHNGGRMEMIKVSGKRKVKKQF